MSNPVNLTNAVKATLSFYARWAIEPGYDWVQVQASTSATGPWTALCGKYTVTGSGNQDPGEPVFDGFQNSWVKEEMSLDNFVGQNIYIRFRLLSDWGLEYDGFYFDDLEITKILPGGVGIIEVLQNNLVAYACMPNPANDYTVINYNLTKSNNDAVLLFTDATGRTVKNITLNKNQSSIKIDLQNMETGIYFYRVFSDDSRSVVRKLIVAGR